MSELACISDLTCLRLLPRLRVLWSCDERLNKALDLARLPAAVARRLENPPEEFTDDESDPESDDEDEFSDEEDEEEFSDEEDEEDFSDEEYEDEEFIDLDLEEDESSSEDEAPPGLPLIEAVTREGGGGTAEGQGQAESSAPADVAAAEPSAPAAMEEEQALPLEESSESCSREDAAAEKSGQGPGAEGGTREGAAGDRISEDGRSSLTVRLAEVQQEQKGGDEVVAVAAGSAAQGGAPRGQEQLAGAACMKACRDAWTETSSPACAESSRDASTQAGRADPAPAQHAAPRPSQETWSPILRTSALLLLGAIAVSRLYEVLARVA